MEPLYYLIHRECRYVSDSTTRKHWRAEGTERQLFLSWEQRKLVEYRGVRKRNEQGMGEGRETARESDRENGGGGVDSVTQRYRGRSRKLRRGWSESSLSRGQAAT